MFSEIHSLKWYAITLIVSVTSWLFFQYINKRRLQSSRLPPGPPGLPILGNLLQMGDKPNETLSHLSCKYGPIMTMRLGVLTTVVISSPEMAREILRTHDHIFSSRTIPMVNEAVDHCKSSIGFAQNGPYLKRMRKFTNENLFQNKALQSLQTLRKIQVHRMISNISNNYVGRTVAISEIVFACALNITGNTVFGTDIMDPDSEEVKDLKDTIKDLMHLLGVPNLADYFPFLKPFDPKGLKKRAEIQYKKLYAILDRFIQRGLQEDCKNGEENNVLAALLEQRNHGLSMANILGYLSDIFAASTDTIAATLEWAMAELLNNPQKMKKLQTELGESVGYRMPEEDECERLEYLNAVVKETLRMHPAVPFLIPRRADAEGEVCGYIIPKDAQILVNVWKIGRDPAVWNEPMSFQPERFLGSETDYKGQHFELIPFGAGRRICSGLPLAAKIIPYVLGCLVHCFDWSLAENSADDMSEEIGVVLHKTVPLLLVPTPSTRCS